METEGGEAFQQDREGGGAQQGVDLRTKFDGDGDAGDEGREGDEKALDVQGIDAYWLQRRISKAIPGIEIIALEP